MLPQLCDKQRRAFLRLGVFLACSAIALSPLAGAPAVPRPHPSYGTIALYGNLRPDPVTTMMPLGRRDPFAPRAADFQQGSVVRAVLLGPIPRALVDLGSDEHLVGVGDTIGGVEIEVIDDSGIVLSDGSRIPLSGTSLSSNPR